MVPVNRFRHTGSLNKLRTLYALLFVRYDLSNLPKIGHKNSWLQNLRLYSSIKAANQVMRSAANYRGFWNVYSMCPPGRYPCARIRPTAIAPALRQSFVCKFDDEMELLAKNDDRSISGESFSLYTGASFHF